VALPLRSPHVHVLCTLERFVSQYGVLVTPVVALLDDVSVLEELRAAPGEVARIFDHPLEALLDPELARGEPLVSLGSEDWPYGMELHVRLSIMFTIILIFNVFVFSFTGWRCAGILHFKTELLGCTVVGRHVSHAPFSEHRFPGEGTHGRHSGMPFLVLSPPSPRLSRLPSHYVAPPLPVSLADKLREKKNSSPRRGLYTHASRCSRGGGQGS
jgi:hypothetical protein